LTFAKNFGIIKREEKRKNIFFAGTKIENLTAAKHKYSERERNPYFISGGNFV
jgi:hypothetical protein